MRSPAPSKKSTSVGAHASIFGMDMRLPLVTLLVANLLPPSALHADEGMWLYNQPPARLLKERYQFELDDAWLEHLRLSSVRFGASAEFVSEDGLVLSNHHVGSRSLQRLSTREHNYLHDGFYARTLAEEKICPGQEMTVLMSIEDVTPRVSSAVQAGMSNEQAFKARRAAMAAIEKESLDKTGLQSEVVTLYQGGQYHLYRYKKYTDVRLVFAPEEQIAFYGGDPDNFEYPRYDLDICIFRAYENGKPAQVKHYLQWSSSGPSENELVFVSGHPGRTDRLRTMAELEYLRDHAYPQVLERLYRLEVLLNAYSARSHENARRARNDLFGVRNSRKARDGGLGGLLDPGVLGQLRASEQKLRAMVSTNAGLSDVQPAWDRIAAAQSNIGEQAVTYDMLERGYGFNSTLFSYARHLLRAPEEQPKPNGERLEEYRESARASFEFNLFAEQPVYSDLEIVKLTDSLIYLAESLGYDHPLVKKVLAGQSPHERAEATVLGSKLASSTVRRQLYSGGAAALREAADPMIELAGLVDSEARAVRKQVEAQQEAIRQAHAEIGKARYALVGTNTYPDATGTLRLAFGTATGYKQDKEQIPFETQIDGLYQRGADHGDQSPFDLPERWLSRKNRLDLKTPFNFVCTADIIGGNSGSPVVNRRGELVGVIFDGNIQSLVADFLYTDELARAVAVHSSAIIEALRQVYDASPLADELLGKSRPQPGGTATN
jgi:hypothetical protein